MKRLPDGLLLGFYGDDFTGSAASLEVLAFAGLPAVLFLDLPTPAQLARFSGVRALGIASTARTEGPGWMREHLPPAFRFLRAAGAPLVHYKICSTLDSAPETGPVGTAIELGAEVCGAGWVPCLVAAPVMRRYQAFGQLFASGGASGAVHRLDRHPVMARHPVTPMDEADVARHLARQTDLPMGLISLEDLAGPGAPLAALARERAAGARVIPLDAVDMGQMAQLGALIWQAGEGFAVGSQGVEYALVEHWRAEGMLARREQTAGAGAAARMVAVSGSVSPVTAAQIAWAGAHGFEVIALDAAAVARGESAAQEAALAAARAALAAGRDPLICSARGPADGAVAAMTALLAEGAIPARQANERIGAALGRVLAQLLRETGIRRAVISGGDTSGHACRELGLFAVTALAPTIPGAALMQGHSGHAELDGLQLALKGGQMGSEDYFGWIKRGGGAAP